MKRVFIAFLIFYACSQVAAAAPTIVKVSGSSVSTKFGTFSVRDEQLFINDQPVSIDPGPPSGISGPYHAIQDVSQIDYVVVDDAHVAVLLSGMESMACQVQHQWIVFRQMPNKSLVRYASYGHDFPMCGEEPTSVYAKDSVVIAEIPMSTYDEKRHKPKRIGTGKYSASLR